MQNLAAKVAAALASATPNEKGERQQRIERVLALSERFSDIKPVEFTLPIGNLMLCSVKSEAVPPRQHR